METLTNIRDRFADLRRQNIKAANETLEILGASFLADDETIFGALNPDYIKRELDWYRSESLNVYDIEGGTPKIWEQVATAEGRINSNYGYLLYGEANGRQFDRVLDHLNKDLGSRRAVAIYTRPSIHDDWNQDGMQDFICTNAVQYLARDNQLNAVVQMRSNDAIFGYRNDYAWQKFNLDVLVDELNKRDNNLQAGNIIWQVGSLHIYERHFHLVDDYLATGNFKTAL